jgi:hypothetical protein
LPLGQRFDRFFFAADFLVFLASFFAAVFPVRFLEAFFGAFFELFATDFFAAFPVVFLPVFLADFLPDLAVVFFAAGFFAAVALRRLGFARGFRLFFDTGGAKTSAAGITASAASALSTRPSVMAALCAGSSTAYVCRDIFSALDSMAYWAACDAVSTMLLMVLFTESVALLMASVSFSVIDLSSSIPPSRN